MRKARHKSWLLGSVAMGAVLSLSMGHQAAAQAVNAGSVSASGSNAAPGATAAPTQTKVFKSGQTVRVLDKQLIQQAGPTGGIARALSYAPGVNINTYGNTGSTKATITLNGVTQGWGGYSGYTQDGAVAVTFDGVPIADVVTGLWQSPTVPQNDLIQNTNVIYGPGNPVDRWYNNIAGEFQLVPLQPTDKAGGDLNLSYGSYGQENLSFDVRSGLYHGWSTIFAGGFGQADSFRKATDGFTNPSHNYAFYAKTIKTFSAGSFELGGYIAQSRGYRAQVIPVSANPLITVNGLTAAGAVAPGQLYSQQTSGYYSSLPYNTYSKYDGNQLYMVYGRETISLDDASTLHNLTFFTRIDRLHSRLNDLFAQGPQVDEHNNPSTYSLGDKIDLTEQFAYNTVDIGGYYIHSVYNSRNNFYNPLAPYFGNPDVINAGGKARSSYFNQDNVSAFLQDDFSPVSILHITPGIRVEQFSVNYSPETLQDFNLAPGAAGNFKNQSAGPAAHQSRTGLAPSVDANLQVLPQLALYGSYSEEWKSPQLGGGGGFFQSTSQPGSGYQLEFGQEYQIGFKGHIDHFSVFNHLLFGANYYHLRYSKQSIPVTNAFGNTVIASGTSEYSGVNMFVDDNPVYNLHVSANANFESAKYTSYNVNGNDYSGSPVSYVPQTLVNASVYYDIPVGQLLITPKAWVQYTGTQSIFNNVTSAPSRQKMPSFSTFNLSLKTTVPVDLPYAGDKTVDFTLTALNVLNNKYESYEVNSAGGYFGTAGQSATGQTNAPYANYLMAYPGAPFSIFGTVSVHF